MKQQIDRELSRDNILAIWTFTYTRRARERSSTVCLCWARDKRNSSALLITKKKKKNQKYFPSNILLQFLFGAWKHAKNCTGKHNFFAVFETEFYEIFLSIGTIFLVWFVRFWFKRNQSDEQKTKNKHIKKLETTNWISVSDHLRTFSGIFDSLSAPNFVRRLLQSEWRDTRESVIVTVCWLHNFFFYSFTVQ